MRGILTTLADHPVRGPCGTPRRQRASSAECLDQVNVPCIRKQRRRLPRSIAALAGAALAGISDGVPTSAGTRDHPGEAIGRTVRPAGAKSRRSRRWNWTSCGGAVRADRPLLSQCCLASTRDGLHGGRRPRAWAREGVAASPCDLRSRGTSMPWMAASSRRVALSLTGCRTDAERGGLGGGAVPSREWIRRLPVPSGGGSPARRSPSSRRAPRRC